MTFIFIKQIKNLSIWINFGGGHLDKNSVLVMEPIYNLLRSRYMPCLFECLQGQKTDNGMKLSPTPLIISECKNDSIELKFISLETQLLISISSFLKSLTPSLFPFSKVPSSPSIFKWQWFLEPCPFQFFFQVLTC